MSDLQALGFVWNLDKGFLELQLEDPNLKLKVEVFGNQVGYGDWFLNSTLIPHILQPRDILDVVCLVKHINRETDEDVRKGYYE